MSYLVFLPLRYASSKFTWESIGVLGFPGKSHVNKWILYKTHVVIVFSDILAGTFTLAAIDQILQVKYLSQSLDFKIPVINLLSLT